MASVDEKQGHGRVLEFDKVTKSFAKTDSNEITHALAEVNLTIQPGKPSCQLEVSTQTII